MAAFTSILMVLLLCNSYSLVGSLNDEGYVLLSFKQSIVEDPSASLKNWNSSDKIPCLWNGITCKEERVVSLSFPKTELKGFLPSSLGLLSMLRHLNLRNNNFYGSLPVELFQARGLQSLVLYGNQFSGSVSHEIGKLINLQILDLSQNFFNGSLPISIHQCRRLKTLDVSENNFSGYLPIGLSSSLISLEKLDLSFNKFNGSIPDDMGNFRALKGTVDFSHNLFSGKIPASLGNLPEKVYIDLSYNNLSGSIPQNGALINRGPTAFIGNPELCGPPLKNLCSSKDTSWSSASSFPFLPDNYNPPEDSERHKTRGLSESAVIAIVVGNIIGICLIGLLISYCYSRMCMNSKCQDGTNYGFEKEVKSGQASLCFQKDESETPSDNPEQHDLMPLDKHVSFDLDELLKASAFVIGKSGTGIMYKVVLEGGLNLAVRRLGEGGSQRFKEFQSEVEAIGKLRHPNITSLRAYYWSVDEKLLIYDYMPNGNLANAIYGEPGSPLFKPLSWSSRLKIMRGTANGLVYLHEFSPKKYVHGDLKPKNILLGPNMDAHISDFGLSRLANIAGGLPTMQSSRASSEKQQERQLKSSEANTFISSHKMGCYYQAPEVLKVVKPSQKWDVYSFGVIMLVTITGKMPIPQKDTSEMDLVQWIQRCFEEKQSFSDVLDPKLAQEIDAEKQIMAVLKIAMACAHGSPERRPTMRQVTDALERLNTSAE